MKQRIMVITGTGLFVVAVSLALTAFVRVGAQQDTESEPVMTTQGVEETSERTTRQRPGRGMGSREARLEEYKEKYSERLSAAKEARITGRCKGAQTQVANLSSNVARVISNRQSVYNRVAERLEQLSEKLVVAGVDTTELNASIAELKLLNEQFGAAAEDYQINLSDIAEMDCESDPSTFQAALVAARQNRPELFRQGQEMRRYIQETIRPILTAIRQSLSDDASDSDTATSPENESDGTDNESETESEE